MSTRTTLLWSLSLLVASCGTAEPPAPAAPSPAPETGQAERPVPYPVVPPRGFRQAVENGTRTESGEAGAGYWQQWVEYDLEATVDVEDRTLSGAGTILYHNDSPHRLPVLVVNLLQNYHAEGAERVRPAEVTGGVEIERVAVNGRELDVTPSAQSPGWAVEGTLMFVVPPEPVEPNSTMELELDWSFPIPQQGASGRMGYTDDELFFLAYWYPQMAVFDDVVGWHAEAFRGNAEFYSNFGSYRLRVDAPEGWLVMSTGVLENEEEVLSDRVRGRMRGAEGSDEVVHVVEHHEAGEATAESEDGRLRWEFRADSVRDVAFSVTRNHAWDAIRAPVGDRDGNGQPDYARVDVFWRESAGYYEDAWRYAQHSVDFFSRFTGVPYPWPHMSVVEGGGIIGGGMEFPQMTLIGDYNQAGPEALYNVTAHEIAHMWVPMLLSTNERRYAWFDEGTTTFNENSARVEFFEGEDEPWEEERASYLQVAEQEMEGPIMRWSDLHRAGPAYGIASYAKPGAVLHALRGVLGDAEFEEAYRTFYERWAFRHPYPWDLFHTVEDVTGRDLGWFWRAWYYESTHDGRWFLDQAVEDVERLDSGETRITIRDLGWVPMPVHLRVTRADGEVLDEVIPVDEWLGGADQTSIMIPPGPELTEVVIDAESYFPDLDRENNRWTSGGEG